MPGTYLTGHAHQQSNYGASERCMLEPQEIKRLFDEGRYVTLCVDTNRFGKHKGASVAHRLFYSVPDKYHYVALQDIRTGGIITIWPTKWWRSKVPPTRQEFEKAIRQAQCPLERVEMEPEPEMTPVKDTPAPKAKKLPSPPPERLTNARPEWTPPKGGTDQSIVITPRPLEGAYEFFATLKNKAGKEREVYLLRYDAWNVLDPVAAEKGFQRLKALLVQAKSRAETLVAVRMRIGGQEPAIDVSELTSRLM